MTMISISGLSEEPAVCHIEVDAYIPLRFRSYESSPGVSYLRIGNFKTSLLELLLDHDSNTIRGLTLTSFDAFHEPRKIAVLPRTRGLPITSCNNFKGSPYQRRIDIMDNFSIAIGDDFLEIDLGELVLAQHVIVCGTVEFYVGSSVLAGVRVTGLTKEQVGMLNARKV